jgi:hypothetical protein
VLVSIVLHGGGFEKKYLGKKEIIFASIVSKTVVFQAKRACPNK